MNQDVNIVLSLISHTNIGKTTLSRTLLKQDVGDVRDAPHATEIASSYTMWSAGKDQLVIWDTPGFGNVTSLLKRLQMERGALAWLMHEVVDRLTNRALYSSLEAARNVRTHADVVLYLINAREHPEDAGYVEAEFKLLDALQKPVIMIINQINPEQDKGQQLTQLEQLWHSYFAHHPCLKASLLLDAFTRTWHQELRLVDLVQPLLPAAKQTALARLRSQFVLSQRTLFSDCTALAGQTLHFAMSQRLERTEQQDTHVFSRLVGQLQEHLDAYIDLLVDRHQIQTEGKARLQADINQVAGLLQQPMSETRSGLLSGALAGASSGLMTDILAGGLSLGGGALLGFLGGYLGGFSYARFANLLARGKTVAWKPDALLSLYKLLLSYYLLAALHGRGKGNLQVDAIAPFLAQVIEEHWSLISEKAKRILQMNFQDQSAWQRVFSENFKEAVLRILSHLYPEISEL